MSRLPSMILIFAASMVSIAMILLASSFSPRASSQVVSPDPGIVKLESLKLKKPNSNPSGYSYDPIGKRDPFKPFFAQSPSAVPESKIPETVIGEIKPTEPALKPVAIQPKVEITTTTLISPPTTQVSNDPLMKYELTKYKVVGIVWDVNSPRAVIMDPSNKLFTITKSSKLGNNNGIVTQIKEGEIVVTEQSIDKLSQPIIRVITLDRGVSE
jgi:type IV pilus assembly protein PilP